MNSPHTVQPQRSNTILPWLLLIFVLLGIGVYVGREPIANFLHPVTTATTNTTPITTLTGQGVLRRIQNLNNLETVSFHIETVITSEKAGTWYKAWQDKQSGIFVADGLVIAGIDLSTLQSKDVVVSENGTHVQIQLPPAKILHANLETTRTYDYKTGLFGLVSLDPQLLKQAEDDARQKIQETACASDILSTATTNGQHQIEGLFSLMNIQVIVTPSAVQSCTTTP